MPPLAETSFEIKGVRSVANNISRVNNKIRTNGYDRILRSLSEAFSNKWQVYAPIDKGPLRRSGIKGRPNNVFRKTGRLSLEFGSDLPYAAVQEFMDHYAHPKGGQAHYAQRSLTETRSDVERIGFKAFRGVIR